MRACLVDCIFKVTHLSLKLPNRWLVKLEEFMGDGLVDNEIGPPTSIGESADRDGVGLTAEF